MNRFLLVSLLLLLIGLFCFGIALYSYWTLQNMYEIFAYYGAGEKVFLEDAEIARTLFNLKFGIIKFLTFGLIAWVVGLIFFVKRNNKLLSK